MNRALHATVLLAAAVALAAARDASADRIEVGTIPLGQNARYLDATSGGTFVVTGASNTQDVVVVDGRSFNAVVPAGGPMILGSGTAAVRSMTISRDVDSQVVIGENDGYVTTFSVADIQSMADGGPAAFASSFRIDTTAGAFDAISAIAVNLFGTKIYVGDEPDQDTQVFDFSGTALSGPLTLGRAPEGAVYVQLLATDRVFFGSHDGTLPWMDAISFTPSVLVLDATGTHEIAGLAQATFTGDLRRLAVIDATADALLIVDPNGPSLVTSIGLAGRPTAVAVSGINASTVIWVAEDSPTPQIEAFTDALASAQPAIPLPAAPISLLEGKGYLYAGLANQSLAVVTDRPWVQIASVVPPLVSNSATDVAVTFSSNRAGSGSLTLAGSVVATATVTSGGGQVMTIPSAQVLSHVIEGRNRLRLEVTDSNALTGHDEAVLTYDIPPNPPRNFTLGFGDGKVIARWKRPDSLDVAGYEVYFGLDDTLGGGVPGNSLSSPQHEDGLQYVVDCSNGTTVFVGIRAIDSAGNLSQMTPILSATAQPTSGAADLAGDDGGFLCAVGRAATRPTLAGLWLGAGLLGAAWARRRRSAR